MIITNESEIKLCIKVEIELYSADFINKMNITLYGTNIAILNKSNLY